MAFQWASACGSAVCRLAFIGNSVRGRLRVSFQSDMGNPYFSAVQRNAGTRKVPASRATSARGRVCLPSGAAPRDFDAELAGVVRQMTVVHTEEQLTGRWHRHPGLVADPERLAVADPPDQRASERVRNRGSGIPAAGLGAGCRGHVIGTGAEDNFSRGVERQLLTAT